MSRYLGDTWMIPAIDDMNRAWFTTGWVSVQKCDDCNAWQHPPDEICGSCQSARLSFRECGGEGRVESVVVVHHAVHPALKDRVPYAVAVVSIDDAPGAHAIGNVVNREPGEVEIGARVRATFEEIDDPDTGDRLRIPQWEVV